jgi:hypothetical protein
VLFASAAKQDRPKSGDDLYFEIPAGIEQIVSLKTETHLFLFDVLPADPWSALYGASLAVARYKCTTLGVENRQGNLEITANWRIEGASRPVLRSVPAGTYRPSPPSGMQQVRAKVETGNLEPFEYLFERERQAWDPEFSSNEIVHPSKEIADPIALAEAEGSRRKFDWRLVTGLVPRLGAPKEPDEVALSRAAPESGSFVLVSLRRRPASQAHQDEMEF